jgi:cysteate synthase
MERHYMLRCVSCGKLFEDSGDAFSLDCGDMHGPSLLRAFYKRKNFTVRRDLPGIFRYLDWLPVRRVLERVGRPMVYRSEGIARELGLRKLYIAFNGYWPEKGALLETCSFKELEALSVCARIPVETDRSLVVSSAWNTGLALLQVGSINRIPMLVVVPESAIPDMWMTVEKHPSVRLAVLKGGADYHDAIELGNTIGSLDGFYPEG